MGRVLLNQQDTFLSNFTPSSTTAPQTMRLRLFYGNTEYKHATKAVVQTEADLFLIWIYAKKYANIFLK